MVLSIMGLVACGLDSGGLLAADAGRVDMMKGPLGDDAAVSASSDDGDVGDDATGDPLLGDESATSSDGGTVVPRDASTPLDAGAVKDAGPKVPFTCSGCTAQMCPTQLAACGKGSDCLAYRDCSEACSGMNSSTCSSKCQSMYSGGEAAFGALTLCDFGCGAACVAALSIGTP
jgi:hypothetical protein